MRRRRGDDMLPQPKRQRQSAAECRRMWMHIQIDDDVGVVVVGVNGGIMCLVFCVFVLYIVYVYVLFVFGRNVHGAHDTKKN